MSYSKLLNTEYSQTESVPGKNMVQNNAGGYVFEASDMGRLERFLILGADSGTYYVNKKDHFKNNYSHLLRMLESHGGETVDKIIEISDSNRAPKVSPCLFAMALACSRPNTSAYALSHLNRVVRTGSHLFEFVNYIDSLRGWGRQLRTAINNWYESKDINNLVYQVVKYPGRTTEEGRSSSRWTHRDILRKSHPHTSNEDLNAVYRFIVGKGSLDHPLVQLRDNLHSCQSVRQAINLCRNFIEGGGNFPHEILPKEFADSKEIWELLLPKMPATALLRMMSRLNTYGIFESNDNVNTIINRLTDSDYFKKSRVHPFAALQAYKALNTTTPGSIKDALNDLFYNLFSYMDRIQGTTVIGVDVSGSMLSASSIPNFHNCEIAALMAMVVARTCTNYRIMGFSDKFVDLDITAKCSFEEACRKAIRSTFGRTDAAKPMIWASEQNIPTHNFVTITDCETYAGRVHPYKALQNHRNQFGIQSRSVILTTVATQFTLADPNDPLMLDVSGVDSNTPSIIGEFLQ